MAVEHLLDPGRGRGAQQPALLSLQEIAAGLRRRRTIRGGLGQDVEIDIESDEDIAALFVVERTRFAAPGVGGGAAGGLGFVEINGKKVDSRRPHFVRRGDTIRFGTPGGGGYGDPAERDAQAADRDRLMGYVMPEAAE